MAMGNRDRQILKIALPSIVSNITVPLLGLVDVSIVGHLGAASYIGAIAVGGLMFNIIYWLFAFLRMGTTGMTSQALGQRDLAETVRMIVRSLLVGLTVSLLLLLLQVPLRELSLLILKPTDEVARLATLYYNICIWGAPAMLSLYSLSGWFVGMQNSKAPMAIAIVQNVINIATSLLLVFVFGMKVEGVAYGTLIAQYAGALMAVALWLRYYRRLLRHKVTLRSVVRGSDGQGAMKRFFRVNSDIFFRTLCLVSVTMYFTSASAAQGDTILAVNTLLTQLFTLFSYIMDGFAFAGEALVGKSIGAQNRQAFKSTISRLFVWGAFMCVLFALVYAIGGKPFLSLLTSETEVIDAASPYMIYAVLIPVCGMTGFIMDGVFIGATATRQMLLSMLCAAVTFFLVHLLCKDAYANHALWAAFLLYLLMRGLVQLALLSGVGRRHFGK